MLDKFLEKHRDLLGCKEDINNAYQLLCECYSSGGKVLIAGNGGSSSDAEHIVGELMKCFKIPRPIDSELSQKLKEVDEICNVILK